MRKICVTVLTVVVLSLCLNCGSATLQTPPPSLSPAAQQAFKDTQVIKVLDLLRDVAIDANAQKTTDGTPLVSTATTRQIVMLHESAIKMINASTQGWAAVVYQSLSEINARMVSTEKSVLGNYLTLGLTTLKGLI